MSSPDTIFFDGQCGMCRRSTRLLRRLDWFNRLDFQDLTRLDDIDLPVSRDVAMRSMTMRTFRNTTLIGLPAVRRALRRTPLGFIPSLVLYIPGISHIATRRYNHIARKRKRDVCPMP